MFCPITIDKFASDFIKNNPDYNLEEIRSVLTKTAEEKKNGAKCSICHQPIWAIGTALIGWNGCFSCITGEADNSEDHEIDSVCF